MKQVAPTRGRAGALEDLLRQLAQDGRSWVALGTVEAIEVHSAWGHLLTVLERPSQRQVQARLLHAAVGASEGVTASLAVGDEVLLLYPGGAAGRAVAIPGLTGGARQLPSTADLDHLDLVDAGGATVRLTQAGDVEPVIHATTFQGDLNDFMGALSTFMTALTGAVSVANVAAAATTFQADPRVTTFTSRAGAGFYSAAALQAE